jgi:glycosyltransferase involved in cell wall biosynthesis
MNLVSICIPTFNRPELVIDAVESAIAQSYQLIDIVVSDDSPDDRTEIQLAHFIASGKIRYVRNAVPLKQAENVNQLFDLAQGDLLILLHDDDLLLPNAVAHLVNCFIENPDITAAFGKQYIISHDGMMDARASESLNADYQRTAAFAGRPASTLISAITGQFPNDGYMVRTATARTVRYRDDSDVGAACDFDFGLRLAAVAESFYFLDEYTAKYRLTTISVSSSDGNNVPILMFNLLKHVNLPVEIEPNRQQQMQKYASPAVNRWLALGDRRSALPVYTSPVYGWRRRFTGRGLVHAILLLCPATVGRRLFAILSRLRHNM